MEQSRIEENNPPGENAPSQGDGYCPYIYFLTVNQIPLRDAVCKCELRGCRCEREPEV